MSAGFISLDRCWICNERTLVRVHQDYIDLAQYSEQDPELSSYTGSKFWLVRCRKCHFIQPEILPSLPNYFDRMYDQHWSEDWIEQEFNSKYKDLIFKNILGTLNRRVPSRERRLLDIGAHVGRFIHLAEQAGWRAEGVELNVRASSYAARKTKLPVHQVNAQKLFEESKRYDAITMTDVLEHIPNPVEMLTHAHRLLNVNGWIAVKVPCGPNQLLKERLRARIKRQDNVSIALNMVHINHFSPMSLRLALERAGFSKPAFSVGAPELADITPSVRTVGSKAFRLGVYYLSKIIPGGVHTPLAMNLQAYAQKSV